MSWQQIYSQWKNFNDLDKKVKTNLLEIESDEATVKDAFYTPMEFGTAGMRGIIGAGINRMNIYTVRQATEGLACFIDEQGVDVKKQGVAIAYDSRHQSPEFAMEAAKTLAYHGIPSYVFESLRPTPELSFAVRYFKAIAGIMITASHNPAAYNGYKIYGADGGQMPPADADTVTNYVRKVENPLTVAVVEQQTTDLIHIVGNEVDEAYLEQLKAVTVNSQLCKEMGKDINLVFTPLHGTGKMLGEKALRQAGFEKFIIEPAQGIADPNFSTVTSPNPEEKEAFEYAIRLGKKEQADLLIATDPDADRMGAAVRQPDGEYQVLTGNQLGALMIEYILTAHQEAGTLPHNAVVLKSIVSSELATAICQAFKVKMVDVLTGFKFIAEKIEEYEVKDSQTFMFGFEESYGYLVKSFVRDKDAIQALVLLAEVAAYHKKQGKNLFEALQDLFVKYGYYKEKTISITMAGIDGKEKIEALMKKCRENAPLSMAGFTVKFTEDFQTLQRTNADGKQEKLTGTTSNVLKYGLSEGSWIAIRPSGTEPKIKFYIGATARNEQTVDKKIKEFQQAIEEITQQ